MNASDFDDLMSELLGSLNAEQDPYQYHPSSADLARCEKRARRLSA
jgi:hypothetical protein